MSPPAPKKFRRPLTRVKASLAFVLIMSFQAARSASDTPSRPDLRSFFQKETVTIAVTDSGLGGLSVMAEAVRRMKEAGVFKKVDFVFYNALFSLEGGYNSLRTREEKVRIFSSALESLEKHFHPDLILIACNTLSILYKDTAFSRKTKIPVVGIIETGVDLISQSLGGNPGSWAIIFGTPTTISEGTHKKRLIERGFDSSRIVVQSCPELENYIEKDYAGDETEMLIAACVDEALQKVATPRPPLFVSLNCTHFGYSLPLWEKAFQDAGVKPLGVLNPNSRMIDLIFPPEYKQRFPKTEIGARVVSMVEIAQKKIQSLGKWLLNVSPETAEALGHYDHNASLF
jgi:glutamate racemase